METEQVTTEEATEETTKDPAADNPKGHSIEYLAEKAAHIRWFKHTAKTKVAFSCEISAALLDDLNRSPQYRDAVKKMVVEVSERTPAEILKWIEKWGPEMATRFGKRMSLDAQVTADLINEITAEVTPDAEKEIAEAAAAKEKAKADKEAEAAAKKEAAATKRAEAAAKKEAVAKEKADAKAAKAKESK